METSGHKSKQPQPADSIVAEFTAAVRSGEAPTIADYLDRVSADQCEEALRGLIEAEVSQSPCDATLSVYLERFPENTQAVISAFQSFEKTNTWDADATIHAERMTRCFGELATDSLIELSEPVDFHDGQSLITHGDQSTDLYFIESGTVEARLPQQDGTVLVLGKSTAGSAVGEMALLSDEPRTADVVATSEVKARRLPAEAFHKLARENHTLAEFLTDLVADRLGGADRDALADKVLDNYRIERKLGRGANGIVYAAHHVESRAKVALKMMSHRLVYSAEANRLFQQEADLVSSMDHPNVVRMHDRFDAFHTCFIVMERCEGLTLKETIASNGPLDDATCYRILNELISALKYAHSKGIIHRDIKPDNIMIDPDGTTKLMDFGLAATTKDRRAGICGTVRYMAPEQRRGELVTEAADYFSVGCVLWEMATGQPLFTGSLVEELSRNFENWRLPNRPPDETGILEKTIGLVRKLTNPLEPVARCS